jgi:hypothetical protein
MVAKRIRRLGYRKMCALEVKDCTHWPSKLGDSDGRGSQSEPNHGDPYSRREYGNYYEDTLPVDMVNLLKIRRGC